jgi:hypothetical protein
MAWTPVPVDVASIEILQLEQVCLRCSSKKIAVKYTLQKNWLISILDKVINFKGTIFHGPTTPLSTSQNKVEIS